MKNNLRQHIAAWFSRRAEDRKHAQTLKKNQQHWWGTRYIALMAAVFGMVLGATPKIYAQTNSGTPTNEANEAIVAGVDKENLLYMELPTGRVIIQMLPELAFNHVQRIRELVRSGFYDGVPFHRVIAGFMAQTGDPTGTGSGGSGRTINAEFSQNVPHVRGTVSMARARDPNSADSQFFIVYAPASHLDGQYTIWGKVIAGMEHVDSLKKGDVARNGLVDNPERVISIKVSSDVE